MENSEYPGVEARDVPLAKDNCRLVKGDQRRRRKATRRVNGATGHPAQEAVVRDFVRMPSGEFKSF